jgi:zinc protease
MTTMMTTRGSQINLASLPGPESIARRIFPNGVVGLAYENLDSPSAVVHGWMRVGSIDVPAEKAGLASLTASMLCRGTARRTFAQINEEVESVGAALRVGSSGHTTRFVLKCLAEDLSFLLDILTGCLYHPTLPPEHIEKLRGQILTAIEQREENTQVQASLAFHELMYPGHPYSVSQLGYRETVTRLTREDVEAFYRDHYGARGMGVVIVGAIPREKGLDTLEAAFGEWQGATYVQPSLPAVGTVDMIREKRVAIPGKAQSNILLGWIGLKRTDPDFVKAYFANCILGEFGMMGRVGEHVRDEQGLAYYVSTSLDAGLGAGPWAAAAGVDPENVEPAIKGILAQVQRLQSESAGKEELADNKSYIIGSLPLRLEGNEGIAAQMTEIELYQLGLDYVQRFPSSISALTAEDVMSVAQEYLNPDAYVLAFAGPPTGSSDAEAASAA